jgi:hypothetical protein
MFLNRIHAGNELVKIIPIPIKQETIVLAIPRGGVIIGQSNCTTFPSTTGCNCFQKTMSSRKFRIWCGFYFT